MPPWVNYFSQLEVGSRTDAEKTLKHIRKHFRTLALKLHPDKPSGDGRLFKEALRQKEAFESCLNLKQQYRACRPTGWDGEVEGEEESENEDENGDDDGGNSDDDDYYNCDVPEPDWHDWQSVSRFLRGRKYTGCEVEGDHLSFRDNEHMVRRLQAKEAARTSRKRANGSPPSRQQRRAYRDEARKLLPPHEQRAAALRDLQLERALADACSHKTKK